MAIAVFDCGKTNLKLCVLDGGRLLWSDTRPNAPLAGPPYPHTDAAGAEAWLIDRLAQAAARFTLTDIVPVTHGACAALVTAAGELALPILDYETPLPEAGGYAALRPDFAETLSPDLPLGLNLGRQIFWLQQQFPGEFARARWILPYPQYWAFRLSGRAVSEVTSLGCHTDLWAPRTGRFSSLVTGQGWAALFPPLAAAGAVVGPISSALAARTGLPPTCRVRVGIHDSNASFLRHRLAAAGPFSVVSTGTWIIAMAGAMGAGGAMPALDPARDCLVNVDALGAPVPCARFMGGREYQVLTGGHGTPDADLALMLMAAGAMILPGFSETGGPFPGRRGEVRAGTRASGDFSADALASLASLYLALMTDVCLDLCGSEGPIRLEGPMAGNSLYARVLAALRPAQTVTLSEDAAGTLLGAALLAGEDVPPQAGVPVLPLAGAWGDYREAWHRLANGAGAW